MKRTALIFDADGVIQTTPPAFIDGLRALVAPAEGSAFLEAVFNAEAPCLRGAGDFAAVLNPLLQQWNVQPPLAEVLGLWHKISPSTAVLQTVRLLQDAGHGCFLATNQQALRADFMRHSLGYDALFDASFYSCQLGAAKPDPAFFSAMLTRLPCAASDCLFIDDKKANTAAAAQAGMQVLCFALAEYDPPGEALLEQIKEITNV